MTRAYLFLTLLACGNFAALADEPAPIMLGDLKATQYQICGKGIDIQIAPMQGGNSGRVIIALKNNKTGEEDLFASATATAENKRYDKYLPVSFDNLSKTFVAVDNGRPEIVWGGALTNLKGMQYSLALGKHVYECTALSDFKGEEANDLYGEVARTDG